MGLLDRQHSRHSRHYRHRRTYQGPVLRLHMLFSVKIAAYCVVLKLQRTVKTAAQFRCICGRQPTKINFHIHEEQGAQLNRSLHRSVKLYSVKWSYTVCSAHKRSLVAFCAQFCGNNHNFIQCTAAPLMGPCLMHFILMGWLTFYHNRVSMTAI